MKKLFLALLMYLVSIEPCFSAEKILGAMLEDFVLARHSGVLITELDYDSPLYYYGLRRHDFIVGAEGNLCRNLNEFHREIEKFSGETIEVNLLREQSKFALVVPRFIVKEGECSIWMNATSHRKSEQAFEYFKKKGYSLWFDGIGRLLLGRFKSSRSDRAIDMMKEVKDFYAGGGNLIGLPLYVSLSILPPVDKLTKITSTPSDNTNP